MTTVNRGVRKALILRATDGKVLFDGTAGLQGSTIAFLVPAEIERGVYEAELGGIGMQLLVERSPDFDLRSHPFMLARVV